MKIKKHFWITFIKPNGTSINYPITNHFLISCDPTSDIVLTDSTQTKTFIQVYLKDHFSYLEFSQDTPSAKINYLPCIHIGKYVIHPGDEFSFGGYKLIFYETEKLSPNEQSIQDPITNAGSQVEMNEEINQSQLFKNSYENKVETFRSKFKRSTSYLHFNLD